MSLSTPVKRLGKCSSNCPPLPAAHDGLRRLLRREQAGMANWFLPRQRGIDESQG